MGSPRHPRLHPRVKVGTEAAGDRGSSAESRERDTRPACDSPPPRIRFASSVCRPRTRLVSPSCGTGRSGAGTVSGHSSLSGPWPHCVARITRVSRLEVCGRSALGNSTAFIFLTLFPDSTGLRFGDPLASSNFFIFLLAVMVPCG